MMLMAVALLALLWAGASEVRADSPAPLSPPCSDKTQARLFAAGAKRAHVARIDLDRLFDRGDGPIELS